MNKENLYREIISALQDMLSIYNKYANDNPEEDHCADHAEDLIKRLSSPLSGDAEKDKEIEKLKQENYHLSAEITAVSDGYDRAGLRDEIKRLKELAEKTYEQHVWELYVEAGTEDIDARVAEDVKEFKKQNNL